MKRYFFVFIFLAVLGVIPLACGSNNNPSSPMAPPAPTKTITLSPTITNTPKITNSPTITVSPTITSTPTRTGTPTVTFTPTSTLTVTQTPTPTNSPTITDSPTITATPTITSTPDISFSGTIYPIVSANCFSCHANGNSSGGMSLGNPASVSTVYAAWVGVAASTTNNCGYADYVDSGNANESLVYIKISGSTCSPQMPDGLSPLSSADIQEFQEWIDEGAPDN